MDTHAQHSSADSSARNPLASLGTAVYRIGVLALLAVIALPRLQPMVSDLPPAAGLAQSGFRLGPSRNNNQQNPPQPTITPAGPPSALLTKYGIPTYGDAYPGPEDMLPRNINGVPVVYVVNLPYLDNGRRDTVKADLTETNRFLSWISSK